MFVKDLQHAAAMRLIVVSGSTPVRQAARAFSDRQVGLLVVCGEAGGAIGVVSKSDLIRHMASGGDGEGPVAPVMSSPVVACAPADELYPTWQSMAARGLQNLPVLGGEGRPLGVLDIRDALGALLDAEQYQEQLLANYISGVGYR
jgi:CBS domain-containing protein